MQWHILTDCGVTEIQSQPICHVRGGIHPRLKRPVGRRLAYAAARLLKQQQREQDVTLGLAQPADLLDDGAITGPTIVGCSHTAAGEDVAEAEAVAQQLTLKFNESLLGGEGLMLRPFDANETGIL
jgi:hypothetical protein